MIKHILAGTIAILSVTVGYGQKAWRLRSDSYIGLSIGELAPYGQGQTVNGFSKGPWFLGLGAGLNYYHFRNIPLFLSVTRDLPVSDKKNRLFLILDGGIDLPWYKRGFPLYQRTISSFRPGPYWSAGMAYRWPLSEHGRLALLFSAAYAMKKLTERQTTSAACYNPPDCTVTSLTDKYEYLDRNLTLAVGVEF